MKKIVLISLFIVLNSGFLFSQQLPQFSQYYLNDFAINPAVAGTKGYFEGKSSHRYQWVGITDAPRTYTISVNGPIKSKKMGLGGYIYTDVVGPTKRTGFNASYAYRIKVTESINLSMGLSAGIMQFTIDGSEISLRDQTDAILTRGIQSVLLPDAGFGLYLYHKDFYFGVSSPQLLNNRINFFEEGENPTGKLPPHFFATAGYKYQVSDDFTIEPSLYVRYVNPAPMQIDGSIGVTYKQKVTLTGTYRNQDALSASVSYLIGDKFTIAYAYDFVTSNLKNYSNGTHELLVGVRFHKHVKKPEEIPATD